MARGKVNQNLAILEYALRHLEMERDEIQAKIDHVRRQLGGKAVSSSAQAAASGTSEPRRKRRWAEHRKAKANRE